MKIIVNADDLGYSECVNKAIFDLMSKKKISSATILANGPSADSAIEKMKKSPECSFGVHLNLTEFKPFTDINLWRQFKLVNDDEFCAVIRKVRPTADLKRAIMKEFSAQIEYLLTKGVRISHIDSHQHIHTIPWIFPVLKSIQKKYGIFKARLSLNLYLGNDQILSFKKYCWNFALRNFIKTRTTDYFAPFLWFTENLKMRVRQNRTIELMVHPNAENKNEELSVLYSDWKQNIGFPVQLISYDDL